MKRRIAAGAVTVAALGAGTAVVAWAQDAPPTVEVTVGASKITVAADGLKTGPTRFHFTTKGGEKGVAIARLKEGVTQQKFASVVRRTRNPNAIGKYGTLVASGYFAKEYAAIVTLED